MEYLILIILIFIAFFGLKIQIDDITIEIYPIKRFLKPKCNPPNITYCKKETQKDFDCKTCKWNKK